MSWSKSSGRAVVALVLVLWKPVTASSTPFMTQVASPGQHHDEPKAAESKAIEGFMEDIGFSSFFQDVGVEAAASSPSFTKIMPAASNNFPTVDNFNFDFGSPGERTKEQLEAMREQGFMPTNPFGSSSNLASSNIAPPEAFKSEQSPFGDAGGGFKFPAFETDFGFSGGFGSLGGGDQSHAPVAKEEQKEKAATSAVVVEHRPRGKSASSFRPKYAQRRKDTFSDDPYQESRLYASPSKKEEKKDKGKCEVVHKDGMTCEICNDGHGGFSEHCSHSQNSGKDSKFTNTRKHTSDDVLKPKEAEAQGPAPAYQQSQQRRVQQKQRAPHGGAAAGGRSEHPSDPHSAFDFSIPSSSSDANHQPRPNPQNPHNHYNSAEEPQPVHHQQPAPQQQFHPQQHQQQQQRLHHQHQQQQTYHPQQQQQLYHPATSHRSTSAVEGPAPSQQNTHQNQAPQHAVAFQNHNQHHQQYQQQPQQGASHAGPAGGHPSHFTQNGHQAAAPQPLQPQSAQQHDTQHNPNTYYSYQQPQLHQNRPPGTSYPQSTNNPVHQPAGSTNQQQEPPSIHHGSQPRTTVTPVISDKLPPNYHRFMTVQRDEDAIVPHPSQESVNTHQQQENYQQQPLHPQQQQYHHHQQQQSHHQPQQSNKAVIDQQTPNRHQQQPLHRQPQQNYNQHDQQHHVAPGSQPQQQEHPQHGQPHHHRSFSQKQQTHKKPPAPVSSHSPQENDSPAHYQSNEIQEIHSKNQNRKKFKAQKPPAPHHDDSSSHHDGGSSDHHQEDPKSSNEKSPGGEGDGHRDEERQGGDGDKKKNQGGSQNDSSDSDFDFDVEFRSSFGSSGSPYAQSQQDNVYDKASDPFEGFGSDPFDHFAEGSNTDPYKFDIPEFDETEFNFGPDDHKKLVKKVGIHDEPKQTSNKKNTRVPPTDHRQQSGSQQSGSQQSGSQQNKVAEKNLGYKPPNPQENYKQLGQMVDQFGKKSRSNCKKEIRKSMTCYICPNAHGKMDEECMFASKDPHSQHMMYTEESSYGNPAA